MCCGDCLYCTVKRFIDHELMPKALKRGLRDWWETQVFIRDVRSELYKRGFRGLPRRHHRPRC